jgi:hypothetical protein
MPKIIRNPIEYDQEIFFANYEIERAYQIPQNQLNGARIFNSRHEYAKTLSKNIAYLEVGVGWGNSAQMFIETTDAISADLLDVYDNANGVMDTMPSPKDSLVSHEEYIQNKFSYRKNINTIKANIRDIFPSLNSKYDLMFFDMETERILIRKLLQHFSNLANMGGVIGFTSYTNYDNIHYEKHVGIFQSVNEFLYFNPNWSVDAIVLHDLGFHDIYIKRNA